MLWICILQIYILLVTYWLSRTYDIATFQCVKIWKKKEQRQTRKTDIHDEKQTHNNNEWMNEWRKLVTRSAVEQVESAISLQKS